MIASAKAATVNQVQPARWLYVVTLLVAGGLHAGLWHLAIVGKAHVLAFLHPAAAHHVKIRTMTPAEIEYVKAKMVLPSADPPSP